MEKDNKIFFMFCFHDDLLKDEKEFFFSYNKNEIEKIDREYSSDTTISQNYIPKIYSIDFKNGKKRPKVIKLSITLNKSSFELNEFSIKEKTRFIFADIKIIDKNIFNFIKYINNDLYQPNISKSDYFLNLDLEQKLEIYKKFLEKNNPEKILEYKDNLANDFLDILKKNNTKKLKFSSAINLLCLCYQNTNIDSFLYFSPEIIYIKDKFENDFFSKILLENYNNNKTEFFKPIIENKKKEKSKNLKMKLMNDLIIVYYLLYEKEKVENNEEMRKQSRALLVKLINDRDNLMDSVKMVKEYKELLFLIYEDDENKIKIIIKNINKNEINLDFKKFKEDYIQIVEYQKNKNTNFLNFSAIIEDLIKLHNNNLLSLKDLFFTFEYELNQKENDNLHDKLNKNIDNIGKKNFRAGELKNEKVLDFISYNEIYLSNIDNKNIANRFIKSKNKDYLKRKNVDILKGIDIDSKEDYILSEIKKFKLYEKFSDRLGKYLSIFTNKIKNIENLGIFYILLPKQLFNNESFKVLKEWIYRNLDSFSSIKCKTFKEEINVFMEILAKVAEESIEDFINFFVKHLGEYCKELFIYILNNNKDLKKSVKNKLIMFYISNDENDNSLFNLDSIVYFIENFQSNDDKALEEFLNKINNFIFSEKDFFSIEENDRYTLFTKLLKHKNKFILNKSGEYLINLKEICQSLITKLKNEDIIFYEISPYFGNFSNNLLLGKIANILFFLSDEEKLGNKVKNESCKIYDNIQKQIFNIKNKINELCETSNYLEYFFSQNKEKMEIKKNLDEFINEIQNKKLNEISNSNEINKKYKSFEELIKNAKKNIEKKKNSHIFLEIYNSKQKIIKDQIELLEETCNIFSLAINIIKENPEEIQNNKYINYFYEIGYKNENNLDKEINWLINYQKIKIDEENKNKLLVSLKLLIKKQNIINIIKGILILVEIYKDNLTQTKEEIKYFEELKNKSDELTKNISSNRIKEIIIFLNEKFREISFDNNDSNYKNKILVFFNTFNKNKEAFLFFKEKKLKNIENLKEFLLESDDKELSIYDIDEFIKVIRFFNDDINQIKSSFVLIETFISGIINKDKFEYYLYSFNKYNKIKNLFDKFLKGEGGVFTRIKDIMNSSYFFTILILPKNIYQIMGGYIKSSAINPDKTKQIEINYEELEEIYQKAFISINSSVNGLYVNRFIDFYKEAKELCYIINKIYLNYGYPEPFLIKFIISKGEIEIIFDSKKYSLNELILICKNIKKNCKEIYKKYIAKSDEIKLFYGRQLYLINNCILQNSFEEIKDLLRCQTNGLINQFNNDFIIDKSTNVYERMMKNIIKYVGELLSLNDKKIDDIYLINDISIYEKNKNENDIKMNKDFKYRGFYFYAYNKKEEEVWTLFVNLTGNPPSNANLLYCDIDTTIEEIYIFIIRAIYCKVNSLFCIVIPKNINNYHKSYIIQILKKKAKKESEMMTSCLSILFNSNDQAFHQSIQKINNIKAINLAPHKEEKLDKNKDKMALISSSICGFGKSTFIKNQKDNNGVIIYLPIGGEISKDDLKERIKLAFKNNSNNDSIILHIDLTYTDEKEIVKDFLFKLLILRKCDLNENVIYFKPETKIFIELENNFESFSKYYTFFKKVPERIIELEKINLTKKVKLVSIMLKNLEENKLSKKNIDLDNDNDKEMDHKAIILKYLGITKPNFYQINTFINVLFCEFEKFNNCLGFSPELLKNNSFGMGMNVEEALNLRELLIKSIIKITKYFTKGMYEELIKNQILTKSSLESFDEDKDIINSLKTDINSITYNDIKPSLIVFNNDGNSVSILTTCSENEEEFKNLAKLYNSQDIEFQSNKNNNKKNRSKTNLKNLKSYDDKEIFKMLLNFLDVKGKTEKELKEIIGNYVYTADNFIKVILILLRIRANVPVIMMGETGCGKTTLIEMAYKLINKQNIPIKKLNIHSGITDNDIIKFIKTINEEVIKEDKILLEEKKMDQKKIDQRQIWVFFDEINTCKSMGLLSEIICKKTYRGNPIDKRFVFLAACNPYRLLLKERKMDSILFHINAKKKKLVYSVNPLSHSLLNFVFNFGNLKIEDEKKYIESMVSQNMKSLFKNYEKDALLFNHLLKIQIESISIAQNFMKENNDVSIVSLREVNRFLLFFNFFADYLEKRNENDEKFNGKENFLHEEEIISFYKNKPKKLFYESAINLSLFICYYLRLPDKESRKILKEKLNEKKFFNSDFLKIPSLEMDYVIDSLIIPIGIAKNQALKENLFSALFCIVNKIPLIICGKPGRSKTLCIQILQSSLKGKEGSKSYLCKLYPELIIHKIQGALNTKTDEVISAFSKARQFQKENKNSEKLNLVLMDEMGLAELSPNNPLKVTHFELENQEEVVPFVGITNWSLDASKMNRVIFIIVQEPNEKDLIITAKEIVKSYEVNKENYYDKYEVIFNNLSKAYYNYIEYKKLNNDSNKFFHGSRDFYSLIKNVISDIIKNKKILDEEISDNINNNKILYKICMKNIERNFGGLENSINEFKYYFNKLLNNEKKFENNKEYELLDCLKDSIFDNDSRYLLMISDSYMSRDILNSMLEEINNQIIEKKKYINNYKEENNFENLRKKEIKTFLGSKFKFDEKSIYYCDEILYKIKCQMETENIVILKDLEIVYPSLYELFNRSFVDLQGAKFARLGKSKSLTLVNDNFKVIVLVDKQNIPKEDPPFLNRFEKHIISFSNILADKLISLSDEIYSVLNEIISFNLNINIKDDENKKDKKNKKNELNIDLNKNIKYIDNEEVRGLVYQATKNNIKEKNDIIKYILNKIAPAFTEDLIIIMQKFGFKAKNDFYYENIFNIYKKNYRYSLKNFIEKTEIKFSIIYTFSLINDLLFENNDKEINNNFFDEKINKKTIKEIKISDINSINIIEKDFIDFINDSDKNLCILRFGENDLIKLDEIHNLVNDYILKEPDFKSLNENNANNKSNKSKIYIILIHLPRVNNFNISNKSQNNNDNYYISFLSPTPQYFIDNITNKYSNFLNILESSNETIISDIIKNSNLLSKQIIHSLRYFKYNIINKKKILSKEREEELYNIEKKKEKEIEIICTNGYKDKIIYNILVNKNLNPYILKGLISLFNKKEDILKKIFEKNIINKEDSDFIDTLNIYVEQQAGFYFAKLIYLFDQLQILQTFILNNNLTDNKLIKEEINKYIENIDNINTIKLNLDSLNLNNKIETRILLGIRIPFIQNFINENIFNFIKNEISNSYIQKEYILMNKIISNENLDKEKDKYLEEMKLLNNKLKNELIKNSFIINILKSGEIQLIKDLFNDCLHVFLMRSNIFNDNYDILIEVLDILIQIRLNTRLNDDLNIDFCSDDKIEKIELFPSFLDLFNKRNKLDQEKVERNNYIEHKDKEDENFYLNIFINVLTFIESYSKEIYNILEIFYFLNKNIGKKDSINDIKSIIINKKIAMETSERNPENSQINKICFFYIIESLLTYIIDNLKNMDFFEIYNHFKKIKIYISNVLKIEKKLLLFSKALFTFEIIIKIFNYYEKQKREKKEEEINKADYDSIIKKIFEWEELLFSKKYKELSKNIESINNLLKRIFENNYDKYAELMISIILNRYKIVFSNDFRGNLVKLLIPEKVELSTKKLIEYSYPLISLILGKSEPEQNEKYIEGENTDKYKKKFLGFVYISNDKNYSLKKILNKDYPELNKIIIYYYENCCQNYFEKIKSKEENKEILCKKLCQGISKEYLSFAINFMKENFETQTGGNSGLNILGKHYSIAYIKIYLNYYIEMIFDEFCLQYLDKRKDINKMLFSEETKISNEIKYYTLKLCLIRKNNNYEEFLKFFNEDSSFEFKDYFVNMKLNDSKLFFYSLIPSLKNIQNNKILEFKIYKDFYIGMEEKDIIDKNNLSTLKEFKFKDILYTYLYFNFYKSYLNDKLMENNIKMKLISLLNLKNNSEEDEIIKLLFNDNPFNTTILPKIGMIDTNKEKNAIKIEILFYAFRFVFNILSDKNTNNFFYQLLTKNGVKIINDNMIPGKLSNTNDFITSFEIIKDNFNKDPNYSAYICSCGYHYTIGLCSFPTKEYPCPKCGEIIGGKKHILHKRKGHKRIFYNSEQKERLLSLYYADKSIEYIIFKDLEIEVNNKKNELLKGLKKESKQNFLLRRQKIREINYITFRILNFILHGFILYSNIRGYISDEFLNNNLIESMTCFEIMEKDWEIIDIELKIKQIPNVQIFMNVIFDKILSLMKQQKNFRKDEGINKLFNKIINPNNISDDKLNNFEKQSEIIINEVLNNPKIIHEYISNNNIMTDNLDISAKSIILEADIYNINVEKKFPDMKYFRITKLPKESDFIEEFYSLKENFENYPIINFILEEKSNINNLKYLPIFNNLCNKIIDYCSYRFTREEAKNIEIKEEIRDSDELIDNFIRAYEKLRPLIQQIDCRELKDRKGNLFFNNLNKDQYISNFCLDIGEFNYGFVLTGIYKEMIKWQNEFINIVLNSKNINDKNYSELFEQEIMIQDCKEDDIVKLPKIKDIMNDIIIKNSYQKNYGIIIYNYELIEEELASMILPSIKKFVSDNNTCLRYIVYQFEGFRGNKSNIITRFIEKYNPKELNNEELQIILNYKKIMKFIMIKNIKLFILSSNINRYYFRK